MIIELTYACKMGCNHCMSDCKPDGKNMSVDTFKDVLDFTIRNHVPNWVFSGGEIFEHPDILEILKIIEENIDSKVYTGPVTFITNGRELARNMEIYEAVTEFQRKRKKSLTLIQVTDDPKFYPDPLTKKDIYRLNKLDAIIEGVPGNKNDPDQCLYPHGRALENFPDAKWNTVGPKCGNCILIANQGANTFTKLVYTLLSVGKMCTPVIDPEGNIKVGESALCPAVASIYDSDEEIMNKIKNHKCKACTIAWDRLKETNPRAYEMLK